MGMGCIEFVAWDVNRLADPPENSLRPPEGYVGSWGWVAVTDSNEIVGASHTDFDSRAEAKANYRRLRRVVSVWFPDSTKTSDDDWAVRQLIPNALEYFEADGAHGWRIKEGDEVIGETHPEHSFASREDAEENLLAVVKALSAEIEIRAVLVQSPDGTVRRIEGDFLKEISETSE